ncbi:unnamed protein product [Rotaria sp. Silwood2]|nr:unnamed protein product [Rotaria sp. Silwood2]
MSDDIQKVKRAIAQNHAVVFVGTDVSRYTTNGEQDFATWIGLLKSGLQRCYQFGLIGDRDLDDIIKTFDSHEAIVDDYLSAADRIEDCFKKENDKTNNDVYNVWLKDTVGKLIPKRSELIEAIGELGCPVLTTNYDGLLGDILKKKPLTWNKYKADGIGDSFEEMKNFVLHVHGYYKETESIIFSRSNYKKILDDEFAQSKLKALLEAKIVLFIGYGGEMTDPNFWNLLQWKFRVASQKPLSIYKLVKSNRDTMLNQAFDVSFSENITELHYGESYADLLKFIKSLKSFTPLLYESLSLIEEKQIIRKKYLNFLTKEHGYVSIFGYSKTNISLPLESVYVELKFDPTHPSIKAMKILEISEEFKRKLLSHGFFDENEIKKIFRAIMEVNTYNPQNIYRDFMIDQWLNVLLSNQNIFTKDEAASIKNKINRLKYSILEKSNVKEAKQYHIQQAYNKFRHCIILGHPGSGKTTLSKWLVINMAKQCLGEKNMLFDSSCSTEQKLPILIPIWKYVDQLKENHNEQKKTLLQFIYENHTLDSNYFNDEERKVLSSLIIQSLVQGNVLVIFEGLDEVPVHIDRSGLMKEINDLLERGIDYDAKLDKLSYSIYERKEINSIQDPTIGNRFIITSRIEGNYFEQINYYIPRLTIEDMSNESLKLFCNSYMECIKENSIKDGKHIKEYKTDQLYNDIAKNKDIFQLAINPQLASVIAAIYNQYEDKLPEKRIDLYEKAIEKMIERLINSSSSSSTNYLNKELGLNATILWSIMQEIAEYLHSKVEGLAENILKEIIRKCVVDYQKQSTKDSLINIDDSILKLVNVFKYQAGLLNEFGYNSFRFIHRTFQEYLAAKSIIYFNGMERNEDMILKNIKEKIANPNWRVPLSMTFGILSKLTECSELFSNIIEKLFDDEQISSNTQFSTSLIPYIIIDSLNDMHFSTKDTEYVLIRRLLELLLVDYKNMYGFSRLKEHQELIQSYFSKLKTGYESLVLEWFLEKINQDENIAPCANIIYQLQWYDPKFHEIFLKNLDHDSVIWNWSVDSILRFYSYSVEDESMMIQLKFKNTLEKNSDAVQHIMKYIDWLCIIIALYGGYKNYNTPTSIREHLEITQFLSLSENERVPFLFYYQEVWGRDDPVYRMAVRADTIRSEKRWSEKPIFDKNEIYKESYLTTKILELLVEEKSATNLIEYLRMQVHGQRLSTGEKIDTLILLMVLGDFDIINTVINEREEMFIKKFGNRVEQLICSLKDPIARCSSQVPNYLLTAYNSMKAKQLKYSIGFSDYCKIYLSLIANGGGLPIDTTKLAEAMDNAEDKYALYAEYFAFKFTGADDDKRYNVAVILDNMKTYETDEIIKSFVKISDSVQIYTPVRSYLWPMDIFTFKSNNDDDLPIAFLNCLENIHNNIAFAVDIISNFLFQKGYFEKNPDLITLIVLLNFGTMSKGVDYLELCNRLLPELTHKTNIREFLLQKIQSIGSSYYRSRALSQLAQFYDEKSYELLNESFKLTKTIQEPSFKFQVLEKIFSITHYKEVKQNSFIQEILEELVLSFDSICDHYDRVVASIRLSFYGSGDFRKKYLTNAIETLGKMNEDEEQMKLIIKLKPLIAIYDDLQITLNGIIENLKNKISKYYIDSHYGRILFTEKLNVDIYNLTLTMNTKVKNYIEREENDDFTVYNDNDSKTNDDLPECNISDSKQNDYFLERDESDSEKDDDLPKWRNNYDKKIVDDSNHTNIQALFMLFAQLNDIKLTFGKSNSVNQLWINLYRDTNNQSNIEHLLKVALDSELFLTPQVAIIIDELVRKGQEDRISILFPYITKPSNEVLPIVHRWFTDYSDSQIEKLAALLLTEAKYVFEAGLDTIIDLLKSDNDQIRYRAQRVFQHPERDVIEPSKRISVIGEKTLMKILQNRFLQPYLPRVQTYLATFFFDLLWDDSSVFQNLYEDATKLQQRQSIGGKEMKFFNNIRFINNNIWSSILKTLQSPSHPSYVEEIFRSTMKLIRNDQIAEDDWNEFAQILSATDSSQFQDRLYFKENDIASIRFILQTVCGLTNTNDEAYFQLLDSKIISELTVKTESLSQRNYEYIKRISTCTFWTSTRDLNREILNLLDDFPITIDIMESLIKWLLQKMNNFRGTDDTIFSMMLCENLLCLVAVCAQKDDYLYRKVTNGQDFHKAQMIKLLEKMLHSHPFFLARGSAFILLSAMDNCDQKVIINAMNALFDENLVKEYSVIGIPLIQLSPNEFIDDLLKSLKNERAIKAYEILKILTQYASNEKIDAHTKSKIMNYLAKEIGELKSKRPINYYYTDIKIPFTTTLENELYKTWIKIQGLSGKAQYYAKVEASKK